jgi:hypothetical protein
MLCDRQGGVRSRWRSYCNRSDKIVLCGPEPGWLYTFKEEDMPLLAGVPKVVARAQTSSQAGTTSSWPAWQSRDEMRVGGNARCSVLPKSPTFSITPSAREKMQEYRRKIAKT